jgi:hypothetical protein
MNSLAEVASSPDREPVDREPVSVIDEVLADAVIGTAKATPMPTLDVLRSRAAAPRLRVATRLISPTSIPDRVVSRPEVLAPVLTPILPAPAPAPMPATPEPQPQPQAVAVPAVLPLVQASAIAPVPAPAIQRSTAARSGPAGVINQIPESAWRWLDAYNWTVEWRQGPGPGRVSEAQYATSTIVIWYDTARSDTIWAGAFGHELGHAVSYMYFSDQQMDDWNGLRGLSSWRWVPGTPNDFSVGEGDFAEAFMSYLLGHQVRSDGGALSQVERAWIAANTPF